MWVTKEFNRPLKHVCLATSTAESQRQHLMWQCLNTQQNVLNKFMQCTPVPPARPHTVQPPRTLRFSLHAHTVSTGLLYMVSLPVPPQSTS
jgi:hypothetical protein